MVLLTHWVQRQDVEGYRCLDDVVMEKAFVPLHPAHWFTTLLQRLDVVDGTLHPRTIIV